MCRETKSISEMSALGSLGGHSDLSTEYIVIYASGMLGHWAIAILLHTNFDFQKLYQKKECSSSSQELCNL